MLHGKDGVNCQMEGVKALFMTERNVVYTIMVEFGI